MATITFDTLKFYERLKRSGISENHAIAITEACRNAQSEMEENKLSEQKPQLNTRIFDRIFWTIIGLMLLATLIVDVVLLKIP